MDALEARGLRSTFATAVLPAPAWCFVCRAERLAGGDLRDRTCPG